MHAIIHAFLLPSLSVPFHLHPHLQLQGRAEDTGHGHKNYTVKVVFGRRDDPLLLVYARQLVEQASKTADVPLLLAISLKDRSSSTFQAVMNMLLKNKVW